MTDAHGTPKSGASFTHLDATGAAHMVDVTSKDITVRTATATGVVRVSSEVIALLRSGEIPKGDALSVARIAGIAAAKKTADLIPLCHPLAIDVEVGDDRVSIRATVRTADRTGVEMEALTSVSVAALAFIDMVKAVDPAAVIDGVMLIEKTGGRRGHWQREPST